MNSFDKYLNNKLELKKMRHHTYYGWYRGFELTIYTGYISKLYINFYASNDIKKRLSDEIFKNDRPDTIKFELEDLGCKISICSLSGENKYTTLLNNLEKIIDLLLLLEVKPNVCSAGGYDIEECDKVRIYKKRYAVLGKKGIDLLTYLEEDRKRMLNSIPNHYLLGGLGALLGLLITIIIWLSLELLGFYSPIACAFSVIIGNILYLRLGGKNNLYKELILSVVSLIGITLFTFIFYIIVAKIDIANKGLDLSIMDYIFNTYRFKLVFLNRMLSNLGFTIVGVLLNLSEGLESYYKNRFKIYELPEEKHNKRLEENL